MIVRYQFIYALTFVQFLTTATCCQVLGEKLIEEYQSELLLHQSEKFKLNCLVAQN
ncbi:MAG: hypothetical protein ACOZBL_05930 [Patescibacteria group bacterium]